MKKVDLEQLRKRVQEAEQRVQAAELDIERSRFRACDLEAARLRRILFMRRQLRVARCKIVAGVYIPVATAGWGCQNGKQSNAAKS